MFIKRCHLRCLASLKASILLVSYSLQFVIVDWDGLPVWCDVYWFFDGWRHIRDVEVCVERMICVTYLGAFDMALRVLDWDLCSQNCKKRLPASSCMSVRPSAWNNSAPTGTDFSMFHMRIFRKCLEKQNQVLSQSDKINGYWIWRRVCGLVVRDWVITLFYYIILFYFVLFYIILFYFILLYFILFYCILFYFILFYFILLNLIYFILFYFT